MAGKRNRNIVIKSQFNINGSRGGNAGAFVADYVSRESATERSMAYIPDGNVVPVEGDGVAFTLHDTAISRKETLEIADHVQELHETGVRAIQQLVVSFEGDYLIDQAIVPPDLEILQSGDYQGNYDDVRLRHALRSGVQGLVDNEKYNNPKMVGCIQYDTTHLHAHLVVYEDSYKLGRMHGKEERGVIKGSSLEELAHQIDRTLTLTKMPTAIPTQKQLSTEEEKRPQIEARVTEVDFDGLDDILRLIEEQKRAQARETENVQEERERQEKDAHELIAEELLEQLFDEFRQRGKDGELGW